jgi:hypothetical protein
MNPNHIPNNNDNQIDRVLNALRDTTPPTGMDRRILNILEAHSSQAGVIPRLGSVIPSEPKASRGTPALIQWTAATVAVLVIAAIFTFTSHRHNNQPTTATITHTTSVPAQPITTITHNAPQRTTTPTHIKPTQSQPVETTQPTEDAQLSHPAPPIPITNQERILLRYTRRGHTEDLAQISNEHNAVKEQKDAADFQAFFTPPEIPIGESE